MAADGKPWEPVIEREPGFNPFVSQIDRTGRLENPLPLADDPEAEEGLSVEDERVARETTRTAEPIAPIKPAE